MSEADNIEETPRAETFEELEMAFYRLAQQHNELLNHVRILERKVEAMELDNATYGLEN